MFNSIRASFIRGVHATSAMQSFVYGLVLFGFCSPMVVQAGVLSKAICKPYKQLVDNELFMVIAAIAAVILIIVWKLAPSGTILSKGIGLLAALVFAVNIENVLQMVTGTGLGC